MTQAEQFDTQGFAAALKRVGVPALKADTYAHEFGLLASEAPERVQCFRDVILQAGRCARHHGGTTHPGGGSRQESLDQQVNA